MYGVMDMNIFKINQMLKECRHEFNILQKRWEQSQNEEDKHLVVMKMLEMQILEEWKDQCKEEMKEEF